MSWGKECCDTGGGKKNSRLTFYQLPNVAFVQGTTADAYLLPTYTPDGSVIYCAFQVGIEEARLERWQQEVDAVGLLQIGIDASLYDDPRSFRYSVSFRLVGVE